MSSIPQRQNWDTGSWDDVTLWCVDNTRLGIDKVAGPGSGRVDSRTQYTSFAGNQSLANCRNSGQYVNLNVELDSFGRYVFEGETLGRHCTARYYRSGNDLTGARPADAIVGCGGLVVFHSATDRIQIDCVSGVSGSRLSTQRKPALTVTLHRLTAALEETRSSTTLLVPTT